MCVGRVTCVRGLGPRHPSVVMHDLPIDAMRTLHTFHITVVGASHCTTCFL